MKCATDKFNVGYPLYSIKFLNSTFTTTTGKETADAARDAGKKSDMQLNHTDNFSDQVKFIVTGGGGEGKNGIDNKLTLIEYNKDTTNTANDGKKVNEKKVNDKFNILNEFILNENDDSPTAMDLDYLNYHKQLDEKLSENYVILACNDNSSKIESGQGNKNLKKFLLHDKAIDKQENLLKLVDSKDLLNSNDPDQYLKKIVIANHNTNELNIFKTVSVLSNDNIIFILDFSNWNNVLFKLDINNIVKNDKKNESIEIKDFTISNNLVAFITSNNLLFVYSIFDKRSVFSSLKNIESPSNSSSSFKLPSNLNLTKLQIINNDQNLLVLAAAKTGITLLNFDISVKNTSGNDSTKTSVVTPNLVSQNLITKAFTGITSFAINESKNLLAITTNTNSLLLVNTSNGKILKTWNNIHSFAVTSVDISANGKFIGTVSVDNTVNLIKIEDSFINNDNSNGGTLWSNIAQSKFFGSMILILLLSILFQLLFSDNSWLIGSENQKDIDQIGNIYNKLISETKDYMTKPVDHLEEQRFKEEKQFQDEQKKIVHDLQSAEENGEPSNDENIDDHPVSHETTTDQPETHATTDAQPHETTNNQSVSQDTANYQSASQETANDQAESHETTNAEPIPDETINAQPTPDEAINAQPIPEETIIAQPVSYETTNDEQVYDETTSDQPESHEATNDNPVLQEKESENNFGEDQVKEQIDQADKLREQQRIIEQQKSLETKERELAEENARIEAEKRRMEELKFQEEQQQMQDKLKLEQLQAEQEKALREQQEKFQNEKLSKEKELELLEREKRLKEEEEARKIEELIRISKEKEQKLKEEEQKIREQEDFIQQQQDENSKQAQEQQQLLQEEDLFNE